MFEQLHSRYIKQDGKHKIVYSVRIKNSVDKFSTCKAYWYTAIGCSLEEENPVFQILEDGKLVTWVEDVHYPSQKAIKYTESELNFILKDTLC